MRRHDPDDRRGPRDRPVGHPGGLQRQRERAGDAILTSNGTALAAIACEDAVTPIGGTYRNFGGRLAVNDLGEAYFMATVDPGTERFGCRRAGPRRSWSSRDLVPSRAARRSPHRAQSAARNQCRRRPRLRRDALERPGAPPTRASRAPPAAIVLRRTPVRSAAPSVCSTTISTSPPPATWCSTPPAACTARSGRRSAAPWRRSPHSPRRRASAPA